jgi:hypothetical protein
VTTNPTAPISVEVAVGGSFTLRGIVTNTTNAIVTLCFQRGVAPQVDRCTFTLSTTVGGQLAPFTTMPLIWEGTYYVTAVTNDTNMVSFEASWDIDSCETGQVRFGGVCRAAPSLALPVVLEATAEVEETVFFTLPIAPALYPGNVLINYEGEALHTMSIRASYGNSELDSQTTFAANYTTMNLAKTNSFTMPSSIAGTWYFAISYKTNSTGNSTFSTDTTSVCSKGSEKSCTNPVATLASGNVISSDVGASFVYTMYNATDSNTWRVGVSTQQGAAYNSALTVVVARGYVPYQGQTGLIADWTSGCTLSADLCAQMVTIELPKSNIPYYVAVSYVNSSLAQTPTLIWPSSQTSPCPPCNRGSCPATPANADFGKCKCNYGWAGINCTIPVGSYKIQIIVVITIGVLLLVTAVIGLIAWFISKRKASKVSGYERV